MTYLIKAAAAVLLTSSFFAAGCGQVHIGTVDSTRVQTEAPQIKAVIDEANGKLMEAQQEAQAKFEASPNMTTEEAQQLQMETQRKMAGLNQMYTFSSNRSWMSPCRILSKRKNWILCLTAAPRRSQVSSRAVWTLPTK